MSRIVYAFLIGIVGAGIVHIAVLLLIPVFAPRDVWSRLDGTGADYTFVPVAHQEGHDGATIIKSQDPFFTVAACRFDLSNGPVHVYAADKVAFWSVSVFDRKGQNLYSFNDRNATSEAVDLAVVNPTQMIELRKELPDDFVESIFVEADIDSGMVVLRAFVPDPSWSGIADTFIANAKCSPVSLVEPLAEEDTGPPVPSARPRREGE